MDKTKETAEQAAKLKWPDATGKIDQETIEMFRGMFIAGANWQKEQGAFSREDMLIVYKSQDDWWDESEEGQANLRKDFDEFMKEKFGK